MNFDEYQLESRQTAVYPDAGKQNIIYPLLGLVGETGEVVEKIKKHIRDGTSLNKDDLRYELGDILWYLSQLSFELGISLDGVAVSNIRKLRSRKKRNKLQGSGDYR